MKKMMAAKGTHTRTVPQGGSPTNSGLKTAGPGLSKGMKSKRGLKSNVAAHNAKAMAKHKVGC